MSRSGAAGARGALAEFWWQIAEAGRLSPIRRSPLDVLTGNWSLDNSPGYLWMDLLSRLASPYDFNPFNVNPLRRLVDQFVDFDDVRKCQDMHLYVSATNVETGRVRVLFRQEITLDVAMASAGAASALVARRNSPAAQPRAWRADARRYESLRSGAVTTVFLCQSARPRK